VRVEGQVVNHSRGGAVVQIAQPAGPRIALGVDGELVAAELGHVHAVLRVAAHVEDVGPRGAGGGVYESLADFVEGD